MKDAKRLHFNLDQVSPEKYKDFLKNPLLGNHSITNWELHQVLTNPELRKKTVFCGAGGAVIQPTMFSF